MKNGKKKYRLTAAACMALEIDLVKVMREGRKVRQTDTHVEKLGLDRPCTLMETHQHPGISVHLLYAPG